MAKSRTVYVCQVCGAEAGRWAGQCQGCQAWNTLVETVVAPAARTGPARSGGGAGAARPLRLGSVDRSLGERRPAGLRELDRVLGGGLVPGSAVLLGGDPGVGKSTLLLQILCRLGAAGREVLYVTGEEAPHQVRDRAERLGYADAAVQLLAETDLDAVVSAIAALRPWCVVIDSIQTMTASGLESGAGSISQLREATGQLARVAREVNTPLVLVGHVTKEGAIAGPKALEHMVDAVLYLEGERYSAFRLLRAAKNRFGSTNEVGVFQMGETGLEEVGNPSAFFLAERAARAVGSAVIVTLEGSRPLLMEVQALAAPNPHGNPRRTANGVDLNRLTMLLAVLARRGGFQTASQDIFVNVIGGLAVTEPAADLGIALAVVSSLRDFPLPGEAVVIGEVGLSGEVRSVGQLERRLREAAQLGFRQAAVPLRQLPAARAVAGMETTGVASLDEALAWARFLARD